MNEELTKLQSEMQAQLASLAHKHAHVSFALIGVLVLVLGLMTAGGVFAVKYTNAQLAKADAVDKQYQADKKDWEAQRAQLQTQIDAASQKQQVLVKVVHDRDESADQTISKLTEITEDEVSINQDVYKTWGTYADIDSSQPTHLFEFPKELVQKFNATKIDRDRLDADLKDTKTQLDLASSQVNLLSKSNTTLAQQADECQKDLDGYKKVAKVSRFKKFLHGAEHVGEILAAAVAGYEIGHHVPGVK